MKATEDFYIEMAKRFGFSDIKSFGEDVFYRHKKKNLYDAFISKSQRKALYGYFQYNYIFTAARRKKRCAVVGRRARTLREARRAGKTPAAPRVKIIKKIKSNNNNNNNNMRGRIDTRTYLEELFDIRVETLAAVAKLGRPEPPGVWGIHPRHGLCLVDKDDPTVQIYSTSCDTNKQ